MNSSFDSGTYCSMLHLMYSCNHVVHRVPTDALLSWQLGLPDAEMSAGVGNTTINGGQVTQTQNIQSGNRAISSMQNGAPAAECKVLNIAGVGAVCSPHSRFPTRHLVLSAHQLHASVTPPPP